MATIEQGFLHEQLHSRKQRLEAAVATAPQDAALVNLLQQVDAALDRMEQGSYGMCEECHEPVEQNRLLADPLVRYCLDHLPADQKRALEQDLELAARIQRGLLPPQGLRWDGWEVHYHYEPAGMVSGDYCDVITPANGAGGLLFVLGDVSGKGVAASMLMSQLHAMFRSLCGMGLALGQLVERVNHLFCESALAGQYATLVFGHAQRDGTVEMFSAGHCPVLLVDAHGVERIEATAMPLGMFCTIEWVCHRAQLMPGDTLFLFTDGASEARNAAQQEYGIEQLARFVGQERALAPAALVAATLDDVRRFQAGASKTDDLSLMALRRAG